MKNLRYFAAIVAASLTLASCGLGTTGNTTSNTASSSSQVLTQAGTDILGTLLGSILGNTTSQQSLAGTWTYYGPKVVFESENILSQLGGQVVSSNLESKLGTQLQKMGFSAGKSTLVLNSDKSCTLALGTKSWPGTYVYDASTNKMTLTGVLGMAQMTCTVSVQGNQLYMLFDADKLLAVATSLSSKSASSLSSLLGSYSGLKLGWVMTR
ncbi:MAG: DUF4923 family protein [Bacteroidaceae bacterium]|nr:DUF4923 family protein [Bacteroidaceae bacterium]